MDLVLPYRSLGGELLGVNGGKFESPLYLTNDPSVDFEAATKRYADNKAKIINAANITSGVFAKERFPALKGDVISNSGSGIISLSLTGVVAGEYTKLDVDGKGRVTGGGTLNKDDIPSISWSKVTKDKPSTLYDYGITDAAKKTGDTFTGFVSLMVEATEPNHAVNKNHVDLKYENSDGLSVGDIIRRPSVYVRPNYVRCDGTTLAIAEYNELYQVIGTKFGTTAAPTVTFKLPDCRGKESAGLYFFIKAR